MSWGPSFHLWIPCRSCNWCSHNILTFKLSSKKMHAVCVAFAPTETALEVSLSLAIWIIEIRDGLWQLVLVSSPATRIVLLLSCIRRFLVLGILTRINNASHLAPADTHFLMLWWQKHHLNDVVTPVSYFFVTCVKHQDAWLAQILREFWRSKSQKSPCSMPVCSWTNISNKKRLDQRASLFHKS